MLPQYKPRISVSSPKFLLYLFGKTKQMQDDEARPESVAEDEYNLYLEDIKKVEPEPKVQLLTKELYVNNEIRVEHIRAPFLKAIFRKNTEEALV